VTGDGSNELSQALIVRSPYLCFRYQFQRDVDGRGPSFLLEGEMPAGLGAPGAFKRTQRSFEERANPADLFQGGLPQRRVTIPNEKSVVHVNKVIDLLK
jgi:hypothetical protein